MLTKIKTNLSKSLSENGVSKFLRDIRKFPLLTSKEENELANDWVKNKNFEAAHKLVNSHLLLKLLWVLGGMDFH